MGKARINNALCTIMRQSASKKTEGAGVFITPRSILTARHVVSDAETLEITNVKGRTRTDIRDIYDGHEHGLDVAIITLNDPINQAAASLALNAPLTNQELTGRVSTIFDGQQKQHTIALCQSFDTSNGSARFWTKGDVQPGYSGSPLTDIRGRIFSVATAIYEGGPSNDQGQRPFFGVEPKAFLDFVHSA